MDMAKVNAVLTKALRTVQEGELDGLREEALDEAMGMTNVGRGAMPLDGGAPGKQTPERSYTGTGGTRAPDYSPGGDPDRGGDHGVTNHPSPAEMLMGFLADTATDVAKVEKVSEDAALEAVSMAAADCARRGLIPNVPDPERASAEVISKWTAAAKLVGLQGIAREYVRSMKA
jgi:hypothetical protein